MIVTRPIAIEHAKRTHLGGDQIAGHVREERLNIRATGPSGERARKIFRLDDFYETDEKSKDNIETP